MNLRNGITAEAATRQMIDPDGFRPNVGIVLAKENGQVFWARRAGQDGWQFPQGGMNTDETPEEAMYRELSEETGLRKEHVDVLGSTPGWLRYRLPRRYRRRQQKPLCIGQKQVWFLLQFLADDNDGQRLDADSDTRIRPVPLGRLLVSGQKRHFVQAPRLYESAGTPPSRWFRHFARQVRSVCRSADFAS